VKLIVVFTHRSASASSMTSQIIDVMSGAHVAAVRKEIEDQVKKQREAYVNFGISVTFIEVDVK
jgi:hypothetical protein